MTVKEEGALEDVELSVNEYAADADGSTDATVTEIITDTRSAAE